MEAPDWQPIERTLNALSVLGLTVGIPVAVLAGLKLAELLMALYRAW